MNNVQEFKLYYEIYIHILCYLRNGDLIPFTLQYRTENVHLRYRIKVISVHVLHTNFVLQVHHTESILNKLLLITSNSNRDQTMHHNSFKVNEEPKILIVKTITHVEYYSEK
jgi:hypothetical protein